MVGKDWKLSAAEVDVLATDKPFMDKVPEAVELTEEELALVSGGKENYGYYHHHHHHYDYHRHYYYHHHHHHWW